MKIGLVEKVLIALSVSVVLGSFAFAINAQPQPDSVAVLKTLNMTCASCAGTIETTLLGKPGVSEVKVDVAAAQVTAVYAARATNSAALAEAVTAAGFKSGVARELSLEQYRTVTGESGPGKDPSNKSGCGSSCCN